MKIFLNIKTGTRVNKVEKIDNNNFKVYVKDRPEKGKANNSIVEILANYFNIAKYNIKIVSGLKSKKKVIEIKEKGK